MVNLTPSELPVGTPTDTSVVHSSENNETTNSKGHNERDISRLQSRIRNYSSSKTYEVGDLVFHQQIQRRCIVNVDTPESFDPVKWTAADGIGVKNVEYIYEQADFPPTTTVDIDEVPTTVIPLEDNTAYMIGGTLTITFPLFVDINFKVKVMKVTPDLNHITVATTDPLILTNDKTGEIISVVQDGSDLIFQTATVHDLTGNPVLNISTDEYNFHAETVEVTGATTFKVFSQSFTNTATGDFDQGAQDIELSDLIIRESGTPTVAILGVVLSKLPPANIPGGIGSRFRMRNVEIDNAVGIGSIIGADLCKIENLDIKKLTGITVIEDCKNVIINDVFGDNRLEPEVPPHTIFQFLGNLTNIVNITDCILFIEDFGATNNHMFHFPSTTVDNPVSADLEFHIHDCKDLNPDHDDKLFRGTDDGLNERSSFAFVHDNGKHKDSLVFTVSRWDIDRSSEATTPVIVAMTGIADLADGGTHDWEQVRNERFDGSFDMVNGEVTYSGIKTIEARLNFDISMSVDVSSLDYFIQFSHGDGMTSTDLGSSKIYGTQEQNAIDAKQSINGTWLITLNTGDTVKLRVGNPDGTNFRAVFWAARFTITEVS